MHVEAGDELIVQGRHVGDEDRHGVIIEIHGEAARRRILCGGRTAHESLFTPSSDTHVEHRPAAQRQS